MGTRGASTTHPARWRVTPGVDDATPETTTPTPGGSVVTPGGSVVTPGGNVVTPGGNVVAPAAEHFRTTPWRLRPMDCDDDGTHVASPVRPRRVSEMSGTKLNKSTRLARNQSISNGLMRLPSKTTIPVNGKMVNASDAAKVFEEATEAEKHLVAARAKYKQAIADVRAAEAVLMPLIPPIKSFVQNTFGERSETAAAFGFEPRKLRTTRSARVVMGAYR